MNREIDFYKLYEYSVEVHHDELGSVGRAKLTFGNGKWPNLKFEGGFDGAFGSPKLVDGQKYERIKVVSDTGEIFTLFDFEYRLFSSHADFLAEGDIEAKFKKIYVRYADISEWFMRGQYIQGYLTETLTWVNKPEAIQVEVKTTNEHFSLVTEVRSTSEKTGENLVINEHVIFEFEKLNGLFGVADVRAKCLELSNFISILIACPFSIVSVGVGGEKGEFGYGYFPSFKKVERGSREFSWVDCLMQKRMLDGRWQAAFENYYKSEHREVVLARLAGMQRYDSFWEYKALGYISLLDKVVKKKSHGVRAEVVLPSQDKLDAFNRAVEGVAEKFTDSQKAEMVNIINKVFSWKDRTFAKNFKNAVASADARVIKVINISDDDFSFIKGVRDDIAHGHKIDLGGSGHDRVSQVVNKVTLLLTYWAFLEFGLTSDDFIACLKGSHNPLAHNPGLNRVYLERITGMSDFYEVSEERFKQIEAIKGSQIQACFTRDSNGEIEYSEKYTQMFKDWMRQGKSGVMRPFDMFGIEDSKVKCSGTAYLESGEKKMRLHHVYVIDDR